MLQQVFSSSSGSHVVIFLCMQLYALGLFNPFSFSGSSKARHAREFASEDAWPGFSSSLGGCFAARPHMSERQDHLKHMLLMEFLHIGDVPKVPAHDGHVGLAPAKGNMQNTTKDSLTVSPDALHRIGHYLHRARTLQLRTLCLRKKAWVSTHAAWVCSGCISWGTT